MQVKGLCLIALFLLLSIGIKAQNSLLATDTITVGSGDTLILRKKQIVPYSFEVFAEGKAVPQSAWELIPLSGLFMLKDPAYANKSLVIRYRYFPKFLSQKYAYRTYSMGDSLGNNADQVYIHPSYFKEQKFDEFIEISNLRKSGSISRGITVGNKQSLSVSSGLRLQVDGDLGDDMKIMAAITDENIPIQPDGTTQQISDFDKVFVKIMKGPHSVILGDFEINHVNTNFANFYRNVQGIGISVNFDKVRATANGAVAKGKFHTNSFPGKEGVQGPYRLSGKNNERFIIVLAGSEQVYMNGELMVRGEGNDYIIDYNTGELYFTSQRVVNSSSRVVVDFEYSDRYYNRSLMFAETSTSVFKDRLKIGFSYGRDADNQNAPIDLTFDDQDRDTLRAIGDNAGLAFTSGIENVGFVDNDVRYRRADTLLYGLVFERYVYSVDPDSAVFDLNFSYVGAGLGNYVKSDLVVNGSIWEWVPPDSTGKPSGDYEPIKLLVLPHLLQVADLRVSYNIHPKIKFYSEGALSSQDKNRFSPLDDKDNIDFANKSGVLFDNLKLADSLHLKIDLNHKYVGERYTNLDRIYKVEYGREWNYDDLTLRGNENVSEGLVELRYKRDLRLVANVGVRMMSDRLFTVKQLYEIGSGSKYVQGNYKFTTINTEDKLLGTRSVWNRHNGDVYKKLWKLRLGTEIWLEDKQNKVSDQVQNGSFRFYDIKPYIKTISTEKLDLYLYYNYRDEREFRNGEFRRKSIAHTPYLKVLYRPLDNLSLQNTSSFREYKVVDSLFSSEGLVNSRSITTNLQASYNTQNRIVSTNLIYEVKSEQVARKEVAYIQVNSGQGGQYEWTDINENGVQELDEFQISTNPNVANFIKVLIPTRDLYPTTSLNFSTNLKIDLKKSMKLSRNFFRELVRNTISISNIRVTQNKEAGAKIENYFINPGKLFQDTTLLEAQYVFREDLYFFRNHKRADLRLGYADSKSQQFLAVGKEQRGLRFFSSDQRVNFGKGKSLENGLKYGEKFSKAQNLSSRDYRITFLELAPKFNYQINRKLRLSAGYEFKDKVNRNDSMLVTAKINMHKAIIDAKYNIKDRNNVFTKFEFVYIAQEGTADFSADYELKESLATGFNAIWQVFFTWYLSGNLELSLNYDGRYLQDKPTIHSGRIQLKAFF